MNEIPFFGGDTQVAGLKKLFQIDFIARAFFELAVPEGDYSPLLAINHEDKFLSLSNAEHYILVLSQSGQQGLIEVIEHLEFIQNRKKIHVQLEGQPEGRFILITLKQIRNKAIKNGIPGKNLFLKLELLYNRGLDNTAKIKLVRHKDKRQDLYNLYRTNYPEFIDYQNSQSKNVFHKVDYIVSFIGEEGHRSRFIGVFRVLDEEKIKEDEYHYKMAPVEGFEDLVERVIINWKTAISWHQWIKNKMEVIEIQPGLHYKQFTDYSDFILDFHELKEIVNNQYSDWKRMLSITKGIYLISDTLSGKLYIGSAYGEDGIWGRWVNYVQTNGHGNNKTLKEHIELDKNYASNFRFSILMLLPRTVTADEAIKKERLFKNKLGTNSFGLNNN